MQLVVNIGLGNLLSPDPERWGKRTRVVAAESLEAAATRLRGRSTALVATRAGQGAAPLPERVQQLAPRCRATLLAVGAAELVIYDWQVSEQRYGGRRAPVDQLSQEILAALERHRGLEQRIDQLVQVGFNNSVDSQGMTYHVQTEVTWDDGLVVRTTVLDGGAVLNDRVARFDHADPPSVEVATERARVQHHQLVDAVRQGQPS